MKLGLDIGSTTIKCVVLDDENKLIYSTYERHYSQITEKIAEILDVTPDCVKKHTSSMLSKTGFSSKTKLAAMVVSKRLIVNGF